MTPSIETRIRAIIGALEHLVVPALAEADSIVQEQAGLALAHLKIIEQQLPFVDTYHTICLAEQLRLGRKLLACAAGGVATMAAAAALAAAVDAATARLGHDAAAREDRHAVAGANSQLVIASSLDGTPAFITASQEVLIAHGLRQSARDRAWYGPTGLDPFGAGLPSIPEMVTAERTALQEEELA